MTWMQLSLIIGVIWLIVDLSSVKKTTQYLCLFFGVYAFFHGDNMFALFFLLTSASIIWFEQE